MNIKAESYGHSVILNIKGELTTDCLEAFKKAVEQQSADHEVIDLVLNFESVPFIDSAVLEYLVDLQESFAERLGQIKLAKCDENIRKILEITRLDGVFEVFEDMTTAVKALEA